MTNSPVPTNGARGNARLDSRELTQSSGSQEPLIRAQEMLVEANATVVTFVRRHPVPCLIGAVAAGYFLGRAAARRWIK